MVGDIFRGLGKKREPGAIEPLDPESLVSRIGGPTEPVKRPIPPVPDPCLTYLRVDGPQPAQPRTWRAGPPGSAR